LMGALADLRHPIWLKDWVIAQFIRVFGVDMAQAQESDATRYGCFNEFFTRPLREGARPLADADWAAMQRARRSSTAGSSPLSTYRRRIITGCTCRWRGG